MKEKQLNWRERTCDREEIKGDTDSDGGVERDIREMGLSKKTDRSGKESSKRQPLTRGVLGEEEEWFVQVMY